MRAIITAYACVLASCATPVRAPSQADAAAFDFGALRSSEREADRNAFLSLAADAAGLQAARESDGDAAVM